MSHFSSPALSSESRRAISSALRQEYQLISDRELSWRTDEPARIVLPISSSKPISKPDWHDHLSDLVQSVAFQTIGGLAILANALVIGFETDRPEFGYWHWVEHGFLLLFSLELAARVLGGGGMREFFALDNEDFSWNIFDAIIVAVGVIDALSSIGKQKNESNATLLRMVRLFRIVRIFKIIRFMKQLYLLAHGFVDALRSVFWVTILMVFVHYVCSIVLVRTVGHLPETDEHALFLNEQYGTIIKAMLSLFDLMSQPDMGPYHGMRSSMPFFTIFLICWIIFGSFGMIALLTGVISESMFEKNGLRIDQERLEREEKRNELNTQLTHVYDQMMAESRDEHDHVSVQQVLEVLPIVVKIFDKLSIAYTRHDLEHVVKIMDADESGTISREEFLSSLVSIAEEIRPMSIAELFHSVQVVKSKVTKCQKVLEQVEDIAPLVTPSRRSSKIVDDAGSKGTRRNSKISEDTGNVHHRLASLEMTIHELAKKLDQAIQDSSRDCLSNLEVKIEEVAKAQFKGATDSSLVLKAVENLTAGWPREQAQGVPAVNSCNVGFATKLNICEQGILETRDMVSDLQTEFKKVAINIPKSQAVCRSEVEALCNEVNRKRIWQAAVSEMEARVVLLRNAYNEAEQELYGLQEMIPHEASVAATGASESASNVGAEDGTLQNLAIVVPPREHSRSLIIEGAADEMQEDKLTLDRPITPPPGTNYCA